MLNSADIILAVHRRRAISEERGEGGGGGGSSPGSATVTSEPGRQNAEDNTLLVSLAYSKPISLYHEIIGP